MSVRDEEDAGEAPGPSITPDLFRDWRSPRFGASNPERLNNPVWEWLVSSGWSAYAASTHFGIPGRACGDPGWSFARFGQSSTQLADGRVVLIAGEHEDSYDADFCIYNDVVVHHPDGRIDIFGYPRDVFPPTDFHSANLCGNRIVVVGSLGYPQDRKPGATPVAALDLEDCSISPIETAGEPPGWIHGHSATLADGGGAIVVRGGAVHTGNGRNREFVENGDDWRLDLATWRWQRLTDRKWRQWQIGRADGGPNRLWQLRSLWQFRGVRWAKQHRQSMEAMIAGQVMQLRDAYGIDPDLDLFGRLFTPPVPHQAVPDVEGEPGVHRITVGGIVVRYVERPMAIQLIVEGALPDATSAALLADLRDKLAALENAGYSVLELAR